MCRTYPWDAPARLQTASPLTNIPARFQLEHRIRAASLPRCGASLTSAGWQGAGRQGGYMMALVGGLVSIVVVWLIVIYGSIYLNKNVQ